MSDAIDYIALQKSKAIQYMIAQVTDESNQKRLSFSQTVELAIQRGMEYQYNLDHIDDVAKKEDESWMYLQRQVNKFGSDYLHYQGYHPKQD